MKSENLIFPLLMSPLPTLAPPQTDLGDNIASPARLSSQSSSSSIMNLPTSALKDLPIRQNVALFFAGPHQLPVRLTQLPVACGTAHPDSCRLQYDSTSFPSLPVRLTQLPVASSTAHPTSRHFQYDSPSFLSLAVLFAYKRWEAGRGAANEARQNERLRIGQAIKTDYMSHNCSSYIQSSLYCKQDSLYATTVCGV